MTTMNNGVGSIVDPPPPPYTMCTRSECESRKRTEEISLFERKPKLSDDNVSSGFKRPSSLQTALKKSSLQASLQSSKSSKVPPPSKKFSKTSCSSQRHAIDPRRAVSKYRRSAAGLTDRDRPPPRTVDQLVTTVRYLQRLLISAPKLSFDQSTRIDSWLQVVDFVQDRLRAVQVDLIVTGQTSKFLQYHMTRTYILILYLLADVPAYSHKLGRDALQACMANYWHEPIALPDFDDEMMSYALLLQCHRDDHSGNNAFSFSELYRKKAIVSTSTIMGPRFQWALQFAASWHLGHWHIALRQLDGGHGDVRFDVLARCCLARHLPWMRWKALQTYNVSFGKGEAVAGMELARLLYLKRLRPTASKTSWDDLDENQDDAKSHVASETSALAFCRAVGLPLDDETKRKVRFKLAPLQTLKEKVACIRDDDFVCRFTSDDGPVRTEKIDGTGFDLPPLKWMGRLLLFDY